MLVGMRVQYGLNVCRTDVSVVGPQGQDFVAGCLDGAGLVNQNMAGMGGDGCLVGAQECGQCRQVGLGSAGQQMNINVGAADKLLEQGNGLNGITIFAIAFSLFQVGRQQSIQDFGVRALAVIVLEIEHGHGAPFPGCFFTVAAAAQYSAANSIVDSIIAFAPGIVKCWTFMIDFSY